MNLSAINIYPVKSLRGRGLDRALVDDFGIVNDRRWMLVDQQGKFVTQRKYPVMGGVSVVDTGLSLRFSSASGGVLEVLTRDFGLNEEVRVWGDTVSALRVGGRASEWFSALLGLKVELVYMPDGSFRQVDRQFADYKQRVSFADGFPFLLISEASLNDLNSKLDVSIGMSRFRPNLVVSGCDAYEEDTWKKIRVGEIEFDVAKPCSRCIMTTIDERLLTFSKEPLKTLASYRRNEYGVCFGQNLVHRNLGELLLGDEVEVLRSV